MEGLLAGRKVLKKIYLAYTFGKPPTDITDKSRYQAVRSVKSE